MKHNSSGKVHVFSVIVIAVFLSAALVIGGFTIWILSTGFKEMESEMNVNTAEYDTTVTATIIGNRQSQMSMGEGADARTSDVYCPIYQYEYNNETYTVSGDVSSSDAHYAEGDVTSVLISSAHPEKMYDPNYNAKSEFHSFMGEAKRMMLIPAVTGVFLTVGIVVAVIIIVRRRMQIAQMVSEGNVEIVDDSRWD